MAAVFGYVYRQQSTALRHRTTERLNYQARILSGVSAAEMKTGNLSGLQSILDTSVAMPSIRAVRITDLAGHTLAYSNESSTAGYIPLSPTELRVLRSHPAAEIFENDDHQLMAVQDIRVHDMPVALVWVYPDISEDQVDLSSLLRSAFLFALLAIAANALFSLLLARSVTRPLSGLLRGTKILIRDPERSGVFPLKTRSMNEAGELTRAFNIMVSALNEQRAGLNDTLALLDSMLANAPIGFAFFDRKTRYVRVNQFWAEMDSLSISRHLGRTVQEIFPQSMALVLARSIEQVFAVGEPVRDLELHFEMPGMPGNHRTWLASLYPVRIGGQDSTIDHGDQNLKAPAAGESAGEVRWVGAVVVDTTDRKLSEEMLRRTEKLAATGRLAASIAHEINNPLEAVTNLLYLLRQQPLDSEAAKFAEMAQQELARVSQITQQTLRFYRQSSKPVLTNPGELLDSVISLHQGRLHAANVEVFRDYRGHPLLMAFSGEMRQLFANIIGNALDAMPNGGRLLLSVRPSQAWSSAGRPGAPGVRVVVADTGCGMDAAVRKRIFDAFFTTKESTGTGLGLWISSEIIVKHRGSVRVRSRPADQPLDGAGAEPGAHKPGCGTVFMLFFPFDGHAGRAWRAHANRELPTSKEA